MSRTDLASKRLGGLSLRFVGDMSAAREWAGQGIAALISALFIFPAALLTLWALNPGLASIAAATLALCLFVALPLTLVLPAAHRKVRCKRGALAVNSMERIAVAPELDLAGRTEKEIASLGAMGADLADHATHRATHFALMKALPTIAAAVSGALFLGVAASWNIPAATVAASLAILSILVLPLTELAQAFNGFCGWRIARAKLKDLFALPSESRTSAKTEAGAALTLKLTPFGAEQTTIKIPAGDLVGLRTTSSLEASSILRSVAGLEDHETVGVSFDGYMGVQPSVAYIGSNPLILRGSLRRALTLGLDKRPSGKHVRTIARKFGLRQTLRRIGYSGRVESMGQNLTLKEQMGIELTRVAVNSPSIVVVDNSRFLEFPEFEDWIETLSDLTGATILFPSPPLTNLQISAESPQIGETA